jgi:hypothetical protein
MVSIKEKLNLLLMTILEKHQQELPLMMKPLLPVLKMQFLAWLDKSTDEELLIMINEIEKYIQDLKGGGEVADNNKT